MWTWRQIAAGGMILSLVMALTASAALAENGSRRSCSDCHKEETAVFNRGQTHAPVKEGDCKACHKSHGFQQSLMLVSNPPDLCTECHPSQSAHGNARSGHPIPERGDCLVCHTPHTAQEPGLIRRYGEDTSCLACHRDVKATLDLGAHQPLASDRCDPCHQIHGNSLPSLLTDEEGALCLSCHGGGVDALAAEHRGEGWKERTCLSCHQPHGGAGAGLLVSGGHAPYLEGACGDCHTTSAGGPLREESPVLCQRCHQEFEELAERKHPHQPAAGGDCGLCHNGHSGTTSAILAAPPTELCGECHEGLDWQKGTDRPASVHVPFEQETCGDCHDPHGADRAMLLKADSRDLCTRCHTDIDSLLTSSQVPHAAVETTDCNDCHTPHFSERPSLLRDSQASLCGGCHDGTEPLRTDIYRHLPFAGGNCGECHTVHGGEVEHLLQAEERDLCLRCHTGVARESQLPIVHACFVDQECLFCHLPHSGAEENGLKSSPKELCVSCHPEVLKKAERATHPHDPVADAECIRCHKGHASRESHLLLATERAVCLLCHVEIAKEIESTTTHAPLVDGPCSTCHMAHGSENSRLLHLPATEICQECHDTADREIIERHHGTDLSTVNCAGCHEPHGSNNKGLLAARQHEPFAAGECSVCHGVGVPGPITGSLTEICARCHPDVTAPAAPGENIHGPVAVGECTTCHNPHAGETDFLLVTTPENLCRICHQEKQEPSAVRHAPFSTGNCSDCHESHRSKLSGFLKQEAADLCFTCHQEIEQIMQRGKPHAPVADKKCQACHDPHESNHTGLLVTSMNELCGRCHRTDASLRAKHRNYNMEQGACTGCHDAHASEQPGMLLAHQHPPFAEGNCAVCHASDGALTASGKGLCIACHGSIQGELTLPHTHEATQEGEACLNCHSPHAGNDESILARSSQVVVCFECHDASRFQGVSSHLNATPNCSACHRPHGSEEPKLLNDPLEIMCDGCHDLANQHAHPIGPDTLDPKTGESLSCLSCHTPHGSPHSYLLFKDRRRDLCLECHAVYR